MPTANVGANQIVNGNTTVTFDGSKSTDPVPVVLVAVVVIAGVVAVFGSVTELMLAILGYVD